MIEFNWINNILCVLRIIIYSKWFGKRIKPTERGKDMYILASGPSLTKELEILGTSFFYNKDTLVVNYFVFSELYDEIKPKYYVLSAPDFFYDDPGDITDKVDRMFGGINNRTTWEITLFVPYLAKGFKAWQNRINNPKVKIEYYNTAVSEGSMWMMMFMMKHQLGMPRIQNVIIPGIVFMIQKGYSNIFLLGVDHSWLNQLHVTEDNEVLMSHPHFYKEKVVVAQVKKGREHTRKLHEVISKFYFTFKSYFVLRAFAEKNDTKIYNLTKGSYIDAFERLEIEKLKKNES